MTNTSDKIRPKLIVITPVRNEAWVLEAFLTHCSSWADRIIIADQHSTDGSREIAARFPKVILIDNPSKEMNMAAARLLLFQEVDRIEGDKIVFTLDADEFLQTGFTETVGWNTIIHSTPNTIFCFRWLNIIGDFFHEIREQPTLQTPYEWGCHFDSKENLAELYFEAEKNIIHESRIPCTTTARYVNIDDIRFVHLNGLNTARNQNKLALYQIASILRGANSVSIYRTNHSIPKKYPIANEIPLTDATGNDIKPLVHTSDHGQHYIDEIVSILQREGFRKFKKLCIWDNPDLRAAGVNYRPPILIRMVHRYLHATQPRYDSLVIKAIDKALSLFF